MAEHFKAIAGASPKPLGDQAAIELAKGLFAKHQQLDKAAMNALTMDVELTGEKLWEGERP